MSEENFYPEETEVNTDETKQETFWNEPQQEGVYTEGTYQQQGEYHENTAYEQNAYQQGYYGQNAYQQMYSEPQKPSQAFGIASMVLGIISLVLFCSCLNVPLAIVAVILGVIQLAKAGTGKGMAIAGIITSCLSIVLLIGFVVMFMLSANFAEAFEQGMQEGLEMYEYNYDELFPEDFEGEFDFDDDTF